MELINNLKFNNHKIERISLKFFLISSLLVGVTIFMSLKFDKKDVFAAREGTRPSTTTTSTIPLPPGGGSWDISTDHLQLKWNKPHTSEIFAPGSVIPFNGLIANYNTCGNESNVFDLFFYWTKDENSWPIKDSEGKKIRLPYPNEDNKCSDTSLGSYSYMNFLEGPNVPGKPGRWNGSIVLNNVSIWEKNLKLPENVCGKIKVGVYAWIAWGFGGKCDRYYYGTTYRTINIDCSNDRPVVVSITPEHDDCSSTWSGNKDYGGANNPLSVEAVVEDINGADDIGRVYIGLTNPEVDNMGDSGCSPWETGLIDTFALMLNTNNDTYAITADQKSSETNCPWGNSKNISEANENSKYKVTDMKYTRSGYQVTVTFKLEFKNGFSEGSYAFFGMASDKGNGLGESGIKFSCNSTRLASCWDEKSLWNIDLTPPSGEIKGKIDETNNFEITWSASDNGGSELKEVDRDCGTNDMTNYANCKCTNPGCYKGRDLWEGKREPVTSAPWNGSFVDISLSAEDISKDIRLKIETKDNACNSNIQKSTAAGLTESDPWYMTAWGDTFSGGGYELMQMNKLTDTSIVEIPTAEENGAYFSKYIISRNGGQSVQNRESLEKYILGSYTDANTRLTQDKDKFGVYEYLKALADKNGCEYSSSFSSTQDINIFDGSVSISQNIDYSPSNGKILVASGNVSIGAGVEILDTLVATNESFITESADSRYINYGSIFSSILSLGRTLEDNKSNPAELIIYDPKYLDLLRDCFGETPSVSIREFKYAETMK